MIRNERGTTVFYQWDSNQRLYFPELPPDTRCQVHFEGLLDRSPEACVAEPYLHDGKLCADVPNRMLQHSGSITVYLYIEEDGGSHTAPMGILAVIPREKPSDYVYTETEVLSWHTLDGRVDGLEERLYALETTGGGVTVRFDAETGAMTVGGSAVHYDRETGAMTIGGN